MTALRWRRPAAVATTLVAVVSSAVAAAATTAGPRPTVTRLSARSGRTAGGGSVTVHGNFRGEPVRAVYFGAARASTVTKGAGLVRATTPHHAAGWVNVRVVLADGRTTPFVAADRYRYVAPPRITAVSPGHVSTASASTTVTVTGSSFVAVRSVTVQGLAIHGYRVSTDARRIQLSVPTGRAGVAPVVVATRYGSARTSAFSFVRVAPAHLADPNGRTAGRVQVMLSPGDPEDTVVLRMAAGTKPPATPTSGVAVKVSEAGDVPLSIVAKPASYYSLSAFDRDRFGDYSTPATATVYVDPLSTVTWTQHGAGPVSAPSPYQELISCATGTSCTAIDRSGRVYTWNGTSWSAPDTTLEAMRVGALSCPSASYCMAVGTVSDGDSSAWSRWDGTSWSTPIAFGVTGFGPSDLSCTSTTFCAVIGGSYAGTFDGTTWTVAKTFGADGPRSLSCVDPAFCIAVGTHSYRFDGTAWGAPSRTIFDQVPVSCVSRTFCLTTAGRHPVRYDGTSWTVVGSSTTEEDSLSCASATFCVARTYDSQLATFDGTNWSAELRLGNSYGVSPACAPGSQCVVISNYKGTESTYMPGLT